MACCCPEACAAADFFSRFARRYRKLYRRKGLERTQRQLVAGLKKEGITGARLLEIGCGVGYLHQQLLKQGAAGAIGVDLSDRMIAEARAAAAEQGLADRVDYRVGDFVFLAPQLPAGDVTLLDKVVCCYPDARSLIETSLAKTDRLYALTFPRDRILTRFGVAAMALLLRLAGSRFRSYVHDPRAIEAWITGHGWRKACEAQTPVWLTQVYVREA